MLQWGRGCSSAETNFADTEDVVLGGFNGAADVHPRKLRVRDQSAHASHASMGPRMFIRGNNKLDRELITKHFGLQWGRGCSSAETRPGHRPHTIPALASMGPRMFIRGNLQRALSAVGASMLQWGRGCSSAETSPSRAAAWRGPGFNGAADVHPRKHGGGRRADGRREASMGPRMFIRGNS